ncbi:hypothetical protein PHYSODRAFT_255522 [Phytophthora sojae]|uniref:Uncharacterized protein n=1 Tax=Phytophthora sojae (strain P6497) TaxID=1094619 RepID=G4ZJI6_PHYSP|nr:hypothetical protein PHYSODRAFT_255522 [Phytophthora sojae]EGZ18851.1 hypothetical protein PHYSODRAFT_255522 [Phytophthora sojae]|eukprot:XP_009527909.1 hypothetical protein PHYSODRAFT_255522 [Phytophthora sojae]
MPTLSCSATNVIAAGSLQNWAAETTEAWKSQVQDEWRRQKRLNNSLRFRARKKNELMQLRIEREHLEMEVKRRLTAPESSALEHNRAMCQLALESEALRADNLYLQLKVRQFECFVSPERALAGASTSPTTFGWTAHRASSLTENKQEMLQARLTTRIQCSLFVADTTVTNADINTWPLLVTPPNWSHSQRGEVTTQVLQELDEGWGFSSRKTRRFVKAI